MEYIKSKDIFLLLRDALTLVNPKPMEHGSRVAYMVYMMLKELGGYEEYELADIVMLTTMHDIGAYKTEADKLNDMVRYETKDSMAHSVYGYLFFKYLSPVPSLAKVILYHHMDYGQIHKVDYKYKNIAGYINIAEKMDIYSASMGARFDMHIFDKMAGTKLSSEGLALFYQIEEKYGVLDKIKSDEYMQELDQIIEYMIFNNEDKEKFLAMLLYCLGFKSNGMMMDNIATVCICEDIAEEMMLPKVERELLHYGAMIHDIGMLAIPGEIINAPRKLGPEEINLIRTHVEVSEKLLKGRMQEEVCSIALAHHERCDGSGYPYNISDMQMNMPQRILQVADVVTGLVNTRSYRKPLSKERIIGILNEEASKRRLKQQVVSIMVKSYDEIVEHIRTKFAETMKMYEAINTQYDLISKKYKI